ncbi:hypothetical protein [Mucilaginibacter humi]|nr:hypothetical protein [Mucilaginibacter humi]
MAAIAITVVYFKNLNTSGLHTSQTMSTIPNNTALVFEFNNDDGFYDIFKDNKLFAAVIGKKQIDELDTLRSQLLGNQGLKNFFTGQNTFISLHPLKDHTVALLITIAATKNFNAEEIGKLPRQANKGLLVSAVNIDGKKGYTIYSGSLKKRFYLINKEDGIFTGSFSKELIDQSARYVPNKDKKLF